MDKAKPATTRRNRKIVVLVSESEHVRISEYAAQAGVSRSALLRGAVLEANWADLLRDAFLRALLAWIKQLESDASRSGAVALLQAALDDVKRLPQ